MRRYWPKRYTREYMAMKVGSLFSGGGLGDFGFLAAGMEISWQCEIDEYCQKILALRYPESKKYRDIKTLKGEEIEKVDIITGGFPCQPFSVAGKRKGKDDNRYLWPEMLRVIDECRPRWIVGENVPGIINLALDTVYADLESKGYEVQSIVFPSHAIGALHKRDRLWIIANTGLLGSSLNEKQTTGIKQLCEVIPNSTNSGIKRMCKREKSTIKTMENSGRKYDERDAEINGDANKEKITVKSKLSVENFRDFWKFEPDVGRVANGVANRVHRLKMLGNGQVPACTYVIGKMIMDIERIYGGEQ